MKDKTQKDFKTNEEYIAYLTGYHEGIKYCSEFWLKENKRGVKNEYRTKDK